MKLGTLCYLREAGKTLMIHRNKRPDDFHLGKYNGLGGKLEPGETPEECAIREVREECGLKVRDPQFKGIITFPMFDGCDDWYVFVFEFRDFHGELKEPAEGALEWIDDQKLLDLPLWEGDRIFLPWLNQKKFFSAKFEYNNKKLVDWKVTFY